MISALFLVLGSLSVPASATPGTAYAADTVRHLKGHASLPAANGNQQRSAPSAACHPDVSKSRICRHRQAMAERRASETASAGRAASAETGR